MQNLETWLKGIPYEVAFWNNVFRWKSTFQGMMGWSHYGEAIQLEQFDANAFLLQQPSPLVLDVGAGMSYATGNHLQTADGLRPLDIHYVDPLAFHYNKILRRHHRQLPPIDFGMMEHLSVFYPERNVSLVAIQNALDHSASPMKGIWEALAVLRQGGVLYLNHHPNEAETERYKGFHQYNITEEDGRLVIWNRAERICVDEQVQGMATVSTCRSAETGHVIAVLRKVGDVPPQHITDSADRRKLCTVLLSQNQLQFSLRHTLSYHLTYWRFNVIQFFVQALPWGVKMKLKHLLHR